MNVFHQDVPQVNGQTVLIGHSTGALFIPHILESLRQPIRASYLVAGFWGPLGSEQFDPLNQSFIESHLDWQRVRDNSHIVKLFNGDNDPYVPSKASGLLAEKLETNITWISNGGHLNAEAGFSSFPLLLETIQSDIKTIESL